MTTNSQRQMENTNALRFVISGGGTGGHIFPALAVANAIVQKTPSAKLLFIGAQGKMEMQRVPKAGYDIKGLWISGYQRGRLSANLLLPFKIVCSLFQAAWWLWRFSPQVVLGVGGYSSGITLKVAQWFGIPTVLLEVNAFAGAANRAVAKKAIKICVTADGMERFFDKQKIVLTGNPVRQDLLNINAKREEAYRYFNLSNQKKTVFLFGGSLGARRLNEAMSAGSAIIASRPDVQFYWQCGSLYFSEFQKCDTANLPNVRLVAFVDRMDLAYAMSDVIISRAGGSIAELAVVGKPAILVPSPNVADDHQTANALKLVEKQAAICVKDVEAKEKMLHQAFAILDDEHLAKHLATNIKTLAKPDAANHIADILIQITNKS